MRGILAITKKELKSFLYSPIAYMLTAFFLVVTGFFFYSIVGFVNDYVMRAMQYQQYQQVAQQININQLLYEPFFNNMTIVLMFLLPLLTMRLLSDEKRMRTEEMLLTSPLKISSIIIGKYLAALIVYAGILLLTATFSVFIFIYGNPDPAPILVAYLGLFLIGAAFIAIGTFASSLTENQIIAAVISFSTILLIWVISWAGEKAGPEWSGLLTYLSFLTHFQNMVKGVLDTQDLIYYLSFISMGLYLSYSVYEFRKWR